MEKFAIDKFASLDQNNDGFVSRKELSAALQSGRLRGRELHFITFLLEHLEEIRRAGAAGEHPRWPASPAGISRDDITEYFRMLDEPKIVIARR
jgi:hypothetical protein